MVMAVYGADVTPNDLDVVDVPPRLTGTYAELRSGATLLEPAGVPVWVCAPEEVLRRIPDPPRAKDLERADTYSAVRERLLTDRHPHGVAHLERLGKGVRAHGGPAR